MICTYALVKETKRVDAPRAKEEETKIYDSE